MLAGNAANTDPSKVAKSNICHRCWTSTSDNPFVGGAPCTGSDTVDIPASPSCKMIRQTIIFPTYGLLYLVISHPMKMLTMLSGAGTERTWIAPITRATSHTALDLEPRVVVLAPRPTP